MFRSEIQLLAAYNVSFIYGVGTSFASYRKIALISEAELYCVARHQTHVMVTAGCGEMTHCSPLVLFRVVKKHLILMKPAVTGATCSTSVFTREYDRDYDKP